MKKIIICILIICAFHQIKSQIINEIKQVSGLCISKIDWSNKGTTQRFFDAKNIGIMTEIEISYLKHKYWIINTGFNYTQRGGSKKYEIKSIDNPDGGIGQDVYRFYFNYLSLKTTFRLKYPLGILIPSFYIGPRIDYLVSSSDSYKEFNKVNYGFDTGIELFVSINDYFSTGVGYIYSYQLKEIRNEDEVLSSINPIYCHIISFGIRVTLN
jgi:hypothetical protein